MKTKNKDYNLYRPFSQFRWTTGWAWQASSHLLNLALKETPAAEIKLSFVTGKASRCACGQLGCFCVLCILKELLLQGPPSTLHAPVTPTLLPWSQLRSR